MWTLNFLNRFRIWLPAIFRAAVGWHFFDQGLQRARRAGVWDWGKTWVSTWGTSHSVIALYALVLLSLAGGAGLLAGALTRWSAILLLCVTGYTIFALSWNGGYASYHAEVIYSAGALAVMFLGPGSLSVDRILFGKRALTD